MSFHPSESIVCYSKECKHVNKHKACFEYDIDRLDEIDSYCYKGKVFGKIYYNKFGYVFYPFNKKPDYSNTVIKVTIEHGKEGDFR